MREYRMCGIRSHIVYPKLRGTNVIIMYMFYIRL